MARNLILTLCVGVMPLIGLQADDVLEKKVGTRIEIVRGEVVKVDPDGVHIKQGGATLKYFNKDIQKLTLDLPPSYALGLNARSKGDFNAVISQLNPLVAKYKGAIDPKISDAMISVADAYVELKDYAKAEPLYKEFEKLYPAEKGRANVGLAKLAFNKKDYQTPLKLLQDYLAESTKVASPTLAQERAFCEAHYIVGQCYDQQKNYPLALEHYLLSAVVYPGYKELSEKAQARADALRREQNPATGVPKIYVQ